MTQIFTASGVRELISKDSANRLGLRRSINRPLVGTEAFGQRLRGFDQDSINHAAQTQAVCATLAEAFVKNGAYTRANCKDLGKDKPHGLTY